VGELLFLSVRAMSIILSLIYNYTLTPVLSAVLNDFNTSSV
jgi:hypothetical protein